MITNICTCVLKGGGGGGGSGAQSHVIVHYFINITHFEPIIVVDLVSESLGFSYQECIGIMSTGHYQSYSLSQFNYFLEFV